MMSVMLFLLAWGFIEIRDIVNSYASDDGKTGTIVAYSASIMMTGSVWVIGDIILLLCFLFMQVKR